MRLSRVFSMMLIVGLLVSTMAVTAFAVQDSRPPYPENETGMTYGSAAQAVSTEDEPDLIAAVGFGGIKGYVRREDLEGEMPKSPEEAVAIQKQNEMRMAKAAPGTPVVMDEIPLYAVDGETIVGRFQIISVASDGRGK